MLASSWRTVPAVKLRGLAKVGSPLRSRSSFNFLNDAVGISNSPRTSKVAGMPAFFSLLFRNRQRNRADRAHIQRDIFADWTVAARDAAREVAIFIDQRQRHAVELEFADVVDVFAAGEFMDAALPVAEFLFVISVVEREHRRGVADFDESFARLAADALRWGIRSDEFEDARLPGPAVASSACRSRGR